MIQKFKEYAIQLRFSDLESKLDNILQTLQDDKAPLILPLVGEFSAGKTTLINSLSNSKALECAPDPTTATIYTLHFGAPVEKALIHYPDGTVTETENISDLNNKALIDASVVEVFDTSTKVPSSVMLVDTPGLSSHEIKHRQNLIDFLPQADGVLLTVDVNQPITKSLTDFAKIIELSKRPLYMIITQCDTKSSADVKKQREYILNNTELHLSGIACISAKTGELAEFYNLLKTIQHNKTQILNRVNNQRAKDIAKEMCQRIETLLRTDESEEIIDDKICEQQLNLNKLRRELENINENIKSELEEEGRKTTRRFEDEIFNRLEAIVTGASNNFDREAISAINNTASILLNDYKNEVLKIFSSHSSKCAAFSNINLSEYTMDDLPQCYNINLNEAGHKYDVQIGRVLKVVAVAGTAIVTIGAAVRGAVAAKAATGITTAAENSAQSTLIVSNIADTATDVASIASNRKTVKRIGKIINEKNANCIKKTAEYGKIVSDNLEKVNEYDQATGQRLGQNKGIIESFIGYFTEKTMGRPQRRRIIREYIDITLAPLFKSEIIRIGREISQVASQTLLSESETTVNSMTSSLEEMKNIRQNQRKEYEEKIKTLKLIKKEIEAL